MEVVTIGPITERFIRTVVMPEILATGGATIDVTPYGLKPHLVKADKFQPTTWVVGITPESLYVDWPGDPDMLTKAANEVLVGLPLNAYSGVGFWLTRAVTPRERRGRDFGAEVVVVDAIQMFTNHDMAVHVADAHDQIAIYSLRTGETEVIHSVLRRLRQERLVDLV